MVCARRFECRQDRPTVAHLYVHRRRHGNNDADQDGYDASDAICARHLAPTLLRGSALLLRCDHNRCRALRLRDDDDWSASADVHYGGADAVECCKLSRAPLARRSSAGRGRRRGSRVVRYDLIALPPQERHLCMCAPQQKSIHPAAAHKRWMATTRRRVAQRTPALPSAHASSSVAAAAIMTIAFQWYSSKPSAFAPSAII